MSHPLSHPLRDLISSLLVVILNLNLIWPLALFVSCIPSVGQGVPMTHAASKEMIMEIDIYFT